MGQLGGDGMVAAGGRVLNLFTTKGRRGTKDFLINLIPLKPFLRGSPLKDYGPLFPEHTKTRLICEVYNIRLKKIFDEIM